MFNRWLFFCLETLGLVSKHTADLADQAKDKYDELSGKAKNVGEKLKKDAKDTLDL